MVSAGEEHRGAHPAAARRSLLEKELGAVPGEQGTRTACLERAGGSLLRVCFAPGGLSLRSL